jgi:DNA-binding SARP family transcriptional activator/TolB-like protein
MDPAIRLHLISRMHAWTRTQDDVLPTGSRTRALLAVVALASPKPVSRNYLAALLWHDRPREKARCTLRQEVYKLRDALAPASAGTLEITRHAVLLPPQNVWIDVRAFMRAAPQHLASMPLPEGDLLEDLQGLNPAFDAWLGQQRSQLHHCIRTSAETLLRRLCSPGDAIRLAGHLLHIDPTDEQAWRTLMSAHAERGEHQLAMHAYRQCCLTLADLAKCLPSSQTQSLADSIRGAGGLQPDTRAPSPANAGPHPLYRRVHIGVLPLRCTGPPGHDAGFGATVVADIAATLARHSWITVAATEDLDTDGDATPAETRQNSGIDLLLRGSIHRSATGLRVAMRLVDLRAGGQVAWASRFDVESDDPGSARQDIAARAAAQTEREILTIEAARAAATPEPDLTPYALTMRAMPLVWQLDRESFILAGHDVERALALDPDFVPALTLAAFWHIHQAGQGWARNPAQAAARAAEIAKRAVDLDPRAARPSAIAGHVQAFLHRDLDTATASHARALQRNPNLPMAWALSAATCAYRGDLQQAAWRAAQYKMLLPFDPFAFFYDNIFTIIHLLNRDYAQAALNGRRVTELNPLFLAGYKPYLATLGHLGETRRAETVLARLLTLEPGFSTDSFLASYPLTQPRDQDHYAEGLRRAGAP